MRSVEMSERVGRMISLEVGVSDTQFGEQIASLLMGSPSPSTGTESKIAEGVVATYLRSFEVPQSPDASGPAVWVGFSIRYDENASTDPIVEWILGALTGTESRITLRVDTSEVPLEREALMKLVRSKLEESL
jgi:hypothetical protein